MLSKRQKNRLEKRRINDFKLQLQLKAIQCNVINQTSGVESTSDCFKKTVNVTCNLKEMQNSEEIRDLNNQNIYADSTTASELVLSTIEPLQIVPDASPLTSTSNWVRSVNDISSQNQNSASINFSTNDNTETQVEGEVLHSKKKSNPSNHNCRYEFQKELARTLLTCTINHSHGKKILNTLRKHKCLSYLPRDCRTLYKTPRIFHDRYLCPMDPGQYLHIGVEKCLVKILTKTQEHSIPDTLFIDWNCDGANLNKKYCIWPLQIRIYNIPLCKPEVLGIYKGRRKPKNAEMFLKCFTTEINNLINMGLFYNSKKYKVKIRVAIFDIPAQAFFLGHKGHNSKRPCSRCMVLGVKFNKTMCYTGINHLPRTDSSYESIKDKTHHKIKSPLLQMGMSPCYQVPLDDMHLVHSGVERKLLIATTTNKYESKLPDHDINTISRRIQHIAKYCPREFSRLPESLGFLKDYKATQYRQFLLYFGVVVFYDIFEENRYLHYALFSAAIRSLSVKKASLEHLEFARIAIEKFILAAEHIYSKNFMSYNVHALQHVVDDVKRYGFLENYSAFPYENNMAFFRKYYHKPGTPLEQIFNRLKEREALGLDTDVIIPKSDNYCRLFNEHSNGPYPENFDAFKDKMKIFNNIELKNFCLGTNIRDNCCVLKDNSAVCLVQNIFKMNDSCYFLIQKFLKKE